MVPAGPGRVPAGLLKMSKTLTQWAQVAHVSRGKGKLEKLENWKLLKPKLSGDPWTYYMNLYKTSENWCEQITTADLLKIAPLGGIQNWINLENQLAQKPMNFPRKN